MSPKFRQIWPIFIFMRATTKLAYGFVAIVSLLNTGWHKNCKTDNISCSYFAIYVRTLGLQRRTSLNLYNIFRISENFKTKMFFHVYSLHANFEYEPVKFSVNMLIFHCRSFERSIYIWHKFIKHHAENLIKIVWKIGVYAALPFTL